MLYLSLLNEIVAFLVRRKFRPGVGPALPGQLEGRAGEEGGVGGQEGRGGPPRTEEGVGGGTPGRGGGEAGRERLACNRRMLCRPVEYL
jgi:hypothetical protein